MEQISTSRAQGFENTHFLYAAFAVVYDHFCFFKPSLGEKMIWNIQLAVAENNSKHTNEVSTLRLDPHYES